MVGQALAERLVSIGHEVMIGTRNVEDALARTGHDKFGNPEFGDWHKANNRVKLGTTAKAVAFGEMVINATRGAHSVEALKQADPKDFEGKVILDIGIPLDFSRGMPPSLVPELSNTNSVGEEIQRTFPGARVVKSLNTMNCRIMADPKSIGNGNHINFLCGNDPDAKEKVKSLLRELGWSDAKLLDLGDLTAARNTEAIVPLWVRIMITKQSVNFNFDIVD